MREIKFRYYQSPGYGESKFNIIEYTLDQLEHGKVERLMLAQKTHYGIVGRVQYTGLKDKNGKEIYEGDIVEEGKYMNPWNSPDPSGTYSRKHEVVFYEGAFGYHDETSGDRQKVFKAVGDWVEVIGNIYENPELLEK